jgi:hypothetical protein
MRVLIYVLVFFTVMPHFLCAGDNVDTVVQQYEAFITPFEQKVLLSRQFPTLVWNNYPASNEHDIDIGSASLCFPFGKIARTRLGFLTVALESPSVTLTVSPASSYCTTDTTEGLFLESLKLVGAQANSPSYYLLPVWDAASAHFMAVPSFGIAGQLDKGVRAFWDDGMKPYVFTREQFQREIRNPVFAGFLRTYYCDPWTWTKEILAIVPGDESALRKQPLSELKAYVARLAIKAQFARTMGEVRFFETAHGRGILEERTEKQGAMLCHIVNARFWNEPLRLTGSVEIVGREPIAAEQVQELAASFSFSEKVVPIVRKGGEAYFSLVAKATEKLPNLSVDPNVLARIIELGFTEQTILALARHVTDVNTEILFDIKGQGGSYIDEGTLLHVATKARLKNTVAVLLERGADVNASSKWGATPLLLSAQANDRELVSLLLERGANKRAADVFGFTPLGAAGTGETAALLGGGGLAPSRAWAISLAQARATASEVAATAFRQLALEERACQVLEKMDSQTMRYVFIYVVDGQIRFWINISGSNREATLHNPSEIRETKKGSS